MLVIQPGINWGVILTLKVWEITEWGKEGNS